MVGCAHSSTANAAARSPQRKITTLPLQWMTTHASSTTPLRVVTPWRKTSTIQKVVQAARASATRRARALSATAQRSLML